MDYYLTAPIAEICAPISATVEPAPRSWAAAPLGTANEQARAQGAAAQMTQALRKVRNNLRSKRPGANQFWTVAERAALVELVDAGQPVQAISDAIGRSVRSCRTQIQRMGLRR